MLNWHSVENTNHGVIKQEIILSIRIYLVLLPFFHTTRHTDTNKRVCQ
jgi:hypothetical protein